MPSGLWLIVCSPLATCGEMICSYKERVAVREDVHGDGAVHPLMVSDLTVGRLLHQRSHEEIPDVTSLVEAVDLGDGFGSKR